jgi:hypothetical protein
MAAEYLIDSTNAHVRKVGCDDVGPFALRRYSDALNAVRGAIARVRNEQRHRHPTLFAGGAEGRHIKDNGRGQRQKAWGSTRPHVWKKDCEP